VIWWWLCWLLLFWCLSLLLWCYLWWLILHCSFGESSSFLSVDETKLGEQLQVAGSGGDGCGNVVVVAVVIMTLYNNMHQNRAERDAF